MASDLPFMHAIHARRANPPTSVDPVLDPEVRGLGARLLEPQLTALSSRVHGIAPTCRHLVGATATSSHSRQLQHLPRGGP